MGTAPNGVQRSGAPPADFHGNSLPAQEYRHTSPEYVVESFVGRTVLSLQIVLFLTLLEYFTAHCIETGDSAELIQGFSFMSFQEVVKGLILENRTETQVEDAMELVL